MDAQTYVHTYVYIRIQYVHMDYVSIKVYIRTYVRMYMCAKGNT